MWSDASMGNYIEDRLLPMQHVPLRHVADIGIQRNSSGLVRAAHLGERKALISNLNEVVWVSDGMNELLHEGLQDSGYSESGVPEAVL